MHKTKALKVGQWQNIALWLVIGLSVAGLTLAAASLASDFLNPKVRLWLGGSMVQATLADTPAKREAGLSGVGHLDDDQAMLFVFDYDDRWGIVMRGMKIPLDVIWLDQDKKIVHIESNLQPDAYPYDVYQPPTLARYVIETAAGLSAKRKLSIGDQVEFSIDRE